MANTPLETAIERITNIRDAFETDGTWRNGLSVAIRECQNVLLEETLKKDKLLQTKLDDVIARKKIFSKKL